MLPEKFVTEASTLPSAPYRRKDSTLPARSSAAIQRNPSGLSSSDHSAGCSR
jgi:hypothetical protein